MLKRIRETLPPHSVCALCDWEDYTYLKVYLFDVGELQVCMRCIG